MSTFKKLQVYRKAYLLAMKIFELSKSFPKEEKYSLTDQVRRSSRSVCANFAEAFRKKQYPKHFLSKLSDSDAENSETSTWIDFAFSCQYISKENHQDLIEQNANVGRLLNDIIRYPSKYK